jgi:iron complex outermembrane receptor protein
MTNTRDVVLLACLAAAAFPAVAAAQRSPQNLGQATIEELMDIRVTSPARKSQRAEDVAAAIYVITRDDIRRSGLATLPEILRLAPGVHVARVSASNWAISIRGFSDLYSNKLLVLVDGRSVYSRTFSGVFWDMVNIVVEDIDRIEVIRGPGGVVWGANAVNGVINIMTRPAAETQGLSLDVGVGTFARERLGVRYGGTAGGAAYRVFSQWSGQSGAGTEEVPVFANGWQSLTSGFRTDWSRGGDAFLAEGHVTTNRTRPGWFERRSIDLTPPSADGIANGQETSLLGRWTRTRADLTELQVQAYYTHMRRDENIVSFSERSSDIEAQYATKLGSRHGLMLGGGYRRVEVSADGSFTAQLGSHQIETANVFLQDEAALRADLALTLGVKVDHDTFDRWHLVPSARLMWEVSPRHRLWAAVSRAHRSPAITDRDFRINLDVFPGPGLPILVAYVGNPEYGHEQLLQAEGGYRVRIGSHTALDVTAFNGSYRGLSTIEPLPPAVETTPGPAHLLMAVSPANLMEARANGVELNAHVTPLPRWQIEASYALLHVSAEAAPASLDAGTSQTDGNTPAHQWTVRSAFRVRPGVEVGASVSRVGRLVRLAVPAYTRLDTRAEWKLNGSLTAAAVGQNLLSGHHREFSSANLFRTASVPRSARLDLRWEF